MSAAMIAPHKPGGIRDQVGVLRERVEAHDEAAIAEKQRRDELQQQKDLVQERMIDEERKTYEAHGLSVQRRRKPRLIITDDVALRFDLHAKGLLQQCLRLDKRAVATVLRDQAIAGVDTEYVEHLYVVPMKEKP